MIVFLDIDGVLDSLNWFKSPLRRLRKNYRTEMATYISPRNLFWVSLFCKITKAKIVLSSSWRYGWNEDGTICQDNKGRSVVPTDKLLRKHGMPIYSVTPSVAELKNEYEIDWSIVPDSFMQFHDEEKNELVISKEKFIKYARGAQILAWIEQHNYNDYFQIFEDDYSDVICFKCLDKHTIRSRFYGRNAGFGYKQFIIAMKRYKKWMKQKKQNKN